MGKTYQSITVDASIDNVWAAVRDFHDVSWAAGVLETCEAVGDLKGDQIGAKRVLNGVFHETLRGLNDLEHTVKYTIDDGPSPVSPNDVSGYVGVLHLIPVTDSDTTFVEWSSSWDGSEEACDFCHNIYVALLGALKQHCE